MSEEVTGSAPFHSVLLISAGASHSVALLCKCLLQPDDKFTNLYKKDVPCFKFLPVVVIHCDCLLAKNIDSRLSCTHEFLCSYESWGRNQNGQLGLGTTEDSLVPQKIQAFEGVAIRMVAAGAEHSAAVAEDGELYGWGWGRYGNLGLGDRNDRLVPEKVSAVNMQGEKMVMVACGWRHTISVSSFGGLYTYGWSKYGQLGHGDFKDHLVPYKLETLNDSFISQISGGWRHTMALTSDGKLYGWGWNKFGQVGVGDNVDHCSPVHVKFPHDQKVVQISCGWRHTLAVTERQNVFSWGRGTNGQLGHRESFNWNIPKIIEPLSQDGSSGQHIESSSYDTSSGKTWISPSERYAVVPDDTVQGQTSVSEKGNRSDISVPESDVKRIRI